MKLGAHLSIAGGYYKAVEKTASIGGNCLQIFSSSPRGWNFANPQNDQINAFLKAREKLKVDPVYFHASYLINLADTGKIGHLSKKFLINEMNLAPKMKIIGSIVHLGSYKTEKTSEKKRALTENIKNVLSQTNPKSVFIIENAGSRKIGQTLEEISEIVTSVNSSRIKICLDTCHLFSNGYDLTTDEKFKAFINKFDSLIGMEKLELWHLNNSRDPLNSKRDRHANISEGTIKIKEFENILNSPFTRFFPFIIETPGFDQKGPDKKNIDILKSLVK